MPVKIIMTSCGSAGDMIAMHGLNKDTFTDFHEYFIDENQLADFRATKNAAIVGDRIAKRYDWDVGEDVTIEELGGISFHIAGIFTTFGTSDDFLIFAGRDFLQEAQDTQGLSNQVLVKLKPDADAAVVKEKIEGLPMTFQVSVKREKAHLASALDQLADLTRIAKVVIGMIIVVILIAIGNAVSMMVRERYREFAILRTLGYGKGKVLAMVMGESLLMTLAGGFIGCLIVQLMVLNDLIKGVKTCDITIVFQAGPTVWSICIGLIVLAGMLGTIVPAYRASRLKIVDGLAFEE